MLRRLVCLAGVVSAVTVYGQVPSKPAPVTPDRASNPSQVRPFKNQFEGAPRGAASPAAKYKAFEPLTTHEKDVIIKALMRGDRIDIQMATDICSKKCKECINGAECNLECAKKTCFKPHGE